MNLFPPFEVVHLLLCPEPHHLARVHFTEAVLEAVVILDVAVPIPELVEGGLEHFESTLGRDSLLLHAGEREGKGIR